ncbi:MAG: tRNA pseudouridine(55) synthase TruB [Candidatus Omnitrophica bacterium]|nr:tRNA pseudouridine(55) synthase TruB [Candidatus Omnitrophota bacterium]MCM8817555.1 tRNA pseudouridine(55) synthase TruB [Candidatus Omnitrophota bacterium]
MRRWTDKSVSGFLNVDKPAGITSYDVIRYIKRIPGFNSKIGHTGTLDPLASGVLVICIGNATKKASKFLRMEKEYVASLLLGMTTDTDDIQGKVIAAKQVDPLMLDEDKIRMVVSSFKGEIEQVPPVVSALRKQGERLYKLHRKGKTIIPEPRKVVIHEIEIKKIEIPRIVFRVVCSSGTYVRALCRDIGKELGYGAVQESLIRLRVGQFRIEDSVQLEKLNSESLKTYLLPESIV